MPSFLELCEEYFETRSLYQLLQIDKKSTTDEVKKAYRRLSLVVHPDRVLGNADKELATEKFKILGKVYSILSDEEKRKIYDETGCIEDENDGDFEERDWAQYWRNLFKEITFDEIERYELTYKNSDMEVEDLSAAYKKGEGSMEYIFQYVPFADPREEDRIRTILDRLIEEGQLPTFEAYNDTPRKRQARKRKWEKEAKAAEKLKKELLKKKSSKKIDNKMEIEEDEAEDDVVKAIMARQKQRAEGSDSFFALLEDKYCKKPKGAAVNGKSKKRK